MHLVDGVSAGLGEPDVHHVALTGSDQYARGHYLSFIEFWPVATSLICPPSKLTLKVRALAALVMARRMTSPERTDACHRGSPLTSRTLPNRPMRAKSGASAPNGTTLLLSSRTSLRMRNSRRPTGLCPAVSARST